MKNNGNFAVNFRFTDDNFYRFNSEVSLPAFRDLRIIFCALL